MEEAIRKIPEIVSCHYISGAGTFELQVVSRDLDTFSQFARKVLINLPNVKDLHTSFSLGEVKASSSLPLSHLGARTQVDSRRALSPCTQLHHQLRRQIAQDGFTAARAQAELRAQPRIAVDRLLRRHAAGIAQQHVIAATAGVDHGRVVREAHAEFEVLVATITLQRGAPVTRAQRVTRLAGRRRSRRWSRRVGGRRRHAARQRACGQQADCEKFHSAIVRRGHAFCVGSLLLGHFGHSTHKRSGCLSRPATSPASGPQPAK